jgi:hypothetical protein
VRERLVDWDVRTYSEGRAIGTQCGECTTSTPASLRAMCPPQQCPPVCPCSRGARHPRLLRPPPPPGLFEALAAAGYSGPITFESFSSAVVSEQLSNTL